MSAVKGNALQLIRNLQCVDDNYAEAKKILEEQYNKSLAVKEQLLLSCIRFKVPKVGQDFSGFVSAVINLNVFIGELKRHHEVDILAEKSGSELVRAIVHDILPGDILDKYQSLTGQEYPTLQQFISKARDVADRLTQKRRNRDNSDHQKQPKHIEEITPTATISTIGKQQNYPLKQKSKICMFCGDTAHISSRCTKFVTVAERADAIKAKKGSDPCAKCLINHKSNISCLPCSFPGCGAQNAHGVLACPKLLKQIVTGENDSSNISVTSKKSCCVALPTLTAQIESPVKDKADQVVGILMDTAAQQSLVSRTVVERLGIVPFKQEHTSLIGFGMSRAMSKTYDVVRIKLFKNNYQAKATITCLVVDRPPAVCKMTGLCLLAKKLAKRGADIGDLRLLNQKQDNLTSDILLGADYFMSVLSVQKPITRLMGNTLLNSIFGQCVIGKIAGSTKLADPTAVSQLSIVHVATNGDEELEEAAGLNSTDNLQTMSSAFSISDKLISIHSDGLKSSEKLKTAFNISNSNICLTGEETQVPEILDTKVRATNLQYSSQISNIASTVSVRNSSPNFNAKDFHGINFKSDKFKDNSIAIPNIFDFGKIPFLRIYSLNIFVFMAIYFLLFVLGPFRSFHGTAVKLETKHCAFEKEWFALGQLGNGNVHWKDNATNLSWLRQRPKSKFPMQHISEDGMLYGREFTGGNALHYWFFVRKPAFIFWKSHLGNWLSLFKMDSFLGISKMMQQSLCRAWVTTLSKVSSCPWTGYCHTRTKFGKSKIFFPMEKYNIPPFTNSNFTKSFL